MAEARIRFYGLDTRQINDDAEDGLLEYANNVRPYGTLEKPYWVPFRNFQGESIDNTIPVIPTFPCESVINSGGQGITEFQLPLDAEGGIYAFKCAPISIVDKFEIIHNGIKVATSGMTVLNGGPFDNTDLSTADQFIGSAKGTVPNRNTAFGSETSFVATAASGEQMVWWVYDAGDYTESSVAILRITGTGGTAWTVTRVCE